MKLNKKVILIGSGIAGLLVLVIIGVGIFYIFKLNDDNKKLNNKVADLQNTNQSPTPTETIIPSVAPTDIISSTPVVSTAIPTATPVANQSSVKVYFSKDPSSYDITDIVVSSPRTTNSTDLYHFAMDEMLKGPTSEEEIHGYFRPFNLTGSSNCGGAAYQLTKSGNKVTLKFCKTIEELQNTGSGGGYAGSSLKAYQRVLNVLSSTLKFNGVNTLEIRNMNNVCYGKDADSNNLNKCN
jgi:hypothetical protein